MGMCASGEIFQAKVDDIIGDINGSKTYIDNLLVLVKGIFSQHIDKLIFLFNRLWAAGLKVNAPKCKFGLNEIPYLVYIVIREGIKSDPKKLQVIMDIGYPTKTTEAQSLINMVQKYRYMCPRR